MTAYQEISAAGRSMHQKCLKASRHLDFHAVRIAKRMTRPPVGKTLVESVDQEYRDVV